MPPTEWPRLAALPELADATRAGVYRVDTTLVKHLERAGHQAALAVVHTDPVPHGNKRRLLTALGHSLAMPDSFTRNWDAFEDGVNDLSWFPARGYVIIAEAAAHQPAIAEALEILQTASRQWANRHIPLWVFLIETAKPNPEEQDR